MQNILNHVSDRKKYTNFRRSVRGGNYAAVSYNVIHGVFVLFTFA